MISYYLRRLWRGARAYWKKIMRNVRVQKWPVTDRGTSKLTRMKQKLESLFVRSK